MALQTSGPISLNEIHIEAGGTTGTTCTIQDADIRELVGAQSASTISFSEFLGAAAPFSYSISNSIGNSVNKMNVATYLMIPYELDTMLKHARKHPVLIF